MVQGKIGVSFIKKLKKIHNYGEQSSFYIPETLDQQQLPNA